MAGLKKKKKKRMFLNLPSAYFKRNLIYNCFQTQPDRNFLTLYCLWMELIEGNCENNTLMKK